MNRDYRDGVTLACDSNAEGSEPILFVHGWGCDHTVFSHQFEHFRARHRVAAVAAAHPGIFQLLGCYIGSPVSAQQITIAQEK